MYSHPLFVPTQVSFYASKLERLRFGDRQRIDKPRQCITAYLPHVRGFTPPRTVAGLQPF